MAQKPWSVWVKLDGSLSVPNEATRKDLLELAEKLMDYAAWGWQQPVRIMEER